MDYVWAEGVVQNHPLEITVAGEEGGRGAESAITSRIRPSYSPNPLDTTHYRNRAVKWDFGSFAVVSTACLALY